MNKPMENSFKPNLEDLLTLLTENKENLASALRNLGQKELYQIINALDKMSRDAIILKKKKFEDKIKSKYISVKEACEYLGVSPATLYRLINNGKINSHKLGGKRVFTIEDLDDEGILGFLSKMENKMERDTERIYCKKTFICVDKKTKEILPFNYTEPYSILQQNKIWVYVYNPNWGKSIKMSKKVFKEHFAVKGEMDYEAGKYGFM